MTPTQHYPSASGRFALLCVVVWLLFPLACRAAEPLAFDVFMRQAERHAFDLRISQHDIALRQLDLNEARSLYLPTVSLRYDLGRLWALDGEDDVVTIGDSVSSTDQSTWQNSFSVSASLLLFDFGARELKVAQAQHRIRGAERERDSALLQVRQEALDAYANALQAQQRKVALVALVAKRKTLFRTLKRLHEAGTMGRVRLEEAALNLATELARLDDAQLAWEKALAALSALTGEPYEPAVLALSPLPTASADGSLPVVEQLPQVKVFDAELDRLQAERREAMGSMLPSIGLGGSYRLYGADQDEVGRAVTDLSQRDASASIVVRWEIFSGFRDRIQLARLDEQIQRITLQRQQRIAELTREIQGLRGVLTADGEIQQRQQQALDRTADATRRLRHEGVLGEADALAQEIDHIEQELEQAALRTRRTADALRLQLWHGEGME